MSISRDSEFNHLGQPVGGQVPEWTGAKLPSREGMRGCFCSLEPLDPARHGAALYEANSLDGEGRMWTYLPYGPFDSSENYQRWIESVYLGNDPLLFAIVDNKTRRAVGVCGYLRIDAANGVIEVGHLAFSPLLQKTPLATEAMYLMMARAFSLGYRRYEWKCHSMNAPSRSAAERLGFSFEGIFRQAAVIKGRNRDTAWYSIIDQEWPRLRAAFSRWLDPGNFDESGRQREKLSILTKTRAHAS